MPRSGQQYTNHEDAEGHPDLYEYVSEDGQLADLVDRMAGSAVLAIDTEFIRERTYYARLCLVQLATDDIEAIVDPLAVHDLTPLARLLADPQTTKVFHAGNQDVEALLRACGTTPNPLFDTQVAASIIGHHAQIGYGALVRELCGVDLPKADSLTDWTRRPLSKTQLRYAIDDVRYLPRMYRQMSDDLERLGRTSWTEADFAHLADPATYENDPQEAWRRVKRTAGLSRKQLAALRVVAAWREETAQRRDLPRRWVLSDEVTVEIARRMPRRVDEVLSLRGVKGRMSTATVRRLIARIQDALAAGPSTWPTPKRKPHAGFDTEAAVDLMSALAHARARENNVSPSLLAPHDEVVRLAAGDEGSELSRGWRRALVGDEMEALLDGQVLLGLDGHRLRVVDLREQAAGASGEASGQPAGGAQPAAGETEG